MELLINSSNKFPEIRECLNISPYPLLIFLWSSVLRYSVSIIIKIGSEKTPIWFFKELKFIPVLLPTEASTIDNNVVGILIKSIPLELCESDMALNFRQVQTVIFLQH